MCEYKNSTFFNTNISNPLDRSFKKIDMPAADVRTGKEYDIDPARTAALLLKSRAARVEQSRDGKLDLDDISWHVLLDLMVSNSEKKSVTAQDLATSLDVVESTMLRYVEYLTDAGLIAKSGNVGNEAQVHLRLTATGEALASNTLSKIGHEFVSS
jgi:DNA-binding MarR family transcriptional regulator